ncbi:MAG: DNA cytosine methyltransferase [Puniceicoccaceae bacterium]
MNDLTFKAVDFFCGAGGMSFGLQRAGIEVLAGIDNDRECKKTYESNIRGARFIKHNICTLSAKDLQHRLKLIVDDPFLIFAGCSPCQFWSKIRTDKRKSEQSAFLLKNFQKFIKYFRPGFVVIENVPGLYKRKNDSILPKFLNFLEKLDYSVSDGIVNANNYGVPQNRLRYLMIATRLSRHVTLPIKSIKRPVVSDFIGVRKGFSRIEAGHKDDSSLQHWSSGLSEKNLKRIQLTPYSGGDRLAWKDDEDLQIPAYINRDDCFRDVYGRMSWDRPAPTITTRFNSLSNGRFGHPNEDRAISIREGASLQTFPKNFYFHGSSMHSLARQIGNAVPPELARKVGKHILKVYCNG